jgi:hypothetical protein
MDPKTAIQILSIAIALLSKAHQVLATGEPQSIEEELKRLEAARLRPSDEIIAEADGAQ